MVRPLLNFVSDSTEREVPDPYYGGPEGFEREMDHVQGALEEFLGDIRRRLGCGV